MSITHSNNHPVTPYFAVTAHTSAHSSSILTFYFVVEKVALVGCNSLVPNIGWNSRKTSCKCRSSNNQLMPLLSLKVCSELFLFLRVVVAAQIKKKFGRGTRSSIFVFSHFEQYSILAHREFRRITKLLTTSELRG